MTAPTRAGAGWAPRRVGPFEVPAVGLGCMNLSHASPLDDLVELLQPGHPDIQLLLGALRRMAV